MPRQNRFACLLGVLIGTALLPLAMGWQQEASPVGANLDSAQAESPADRRVNRENQDADASPLELKYWIGVKCYEVSAALRAQLNIDHGLTVRAVANPSPAQAAGVQAYDVILSVDGESVTTVDELQQIIQRGQGGIVRVELMHGGKSQTIEIQSEQRPPPESLESIIISVGDDELDPAELAKLKAMLDAQGGSDQLSLLLIHSGVAIDPSQEAADAESGNGSSNGKNTPNGAPLHIKKKQIEDEAMLFDIAKLDSVEPLSGCCMKLMQVIAEEIDEHEQHLAALRERQTTLEHERGSASSERQLELQSELDRIAVLIQSHELNRANLLEIRMRLRAKMGMDRKSGPRAPNPGQSLRNESETIYWS